MIADTSAWVEYLRATGSRCHLLLRAALRRHEEVWMPAVVLQEVLQGARGVEQFARLEQQLERLPGLDHLNPRALARRAAWLYARCRWQGVTVRSPNDCLVAAYAVASDQPLLAQDRDYDAIASIAPELRRV